MKYIILKQTPLILKTFPSECILNLVQDSIFIVNRECLTLIITFKTKILLKTRLCCLFFVYVSFREEKQDENTANTALNKTIFLSLPDVVDRCVNLSDIYMTR